MGMTIELSCNGGFKPEERLAYLRNYSTPLIVIIEHY
jgi:hypothetical protein